MAKDSKFLAFDFGAESGRALLGIIENNRLRLEEVHRFPTANLLVLGTLYWDALKLFGEVKHGLRLALAQTGGELDGIGVDTWGVDFGLLGEDGELLGNPVHYRDNRTDGMPEEVFAAVPWEEVYENTGIQFMKLNTLYQLMALVKSNSATLQCASTLLFMPDLMNYWLTGVKANEFCIATTSQCFDPRKGDWAYGMLENLGIPTGIFQKVIQPGTTVGPLAGSLVEEMGMGEGVPVIAPACHDTGCAVAAVPASGSGHAYISSGTWSLVGVETREPIINDRARDMAFTNEGGVCGTIRFLHNIMGLWLVQECRRTWLAAGEEISYTDLTAKAAEAEPFRSIVNPNAEVFMAPGDMPERFRKFCLETGQAVPETKGQVVRCALDSLALAYRQTVEDLDELLGKRVEPIHIVGGGTQNKLLSQLAADVTGRRVVAGPIEATAIGNVLVQAMGRNFVSSLDEAREIVRNSFEVETFEPKPSEAIEEAYRRYQSLL